MSTKKASSKPNTEALPSPAKSKRSSRDAEEFPQFGVSQNIQDELDRQGEATERSDAAEGALFREMMYHELRASEIKRFLQGCGIDVE